MSVNLKHILRFFKHNKFANAFSKNSFYLIISNQVLPLFIAVFATALIYLYDNNLSNWGAYISTLIQVTFELSPLLICKYLSLNSTGKKRYFFWLLGFVFMPLALFTIANEHIGVMNWLISNEVTLGFIVAIELFSVINIWLAQKKTSLHKIQFNLDNVVFGILLIFSLMLAMFLNSSDAPLSNQPINILIDLKRNFFNILSLISYWIQIIVLYGCLYLIFLMNHHILVKRVLSQRGVFTYLWTTILFLLIFYPVLAQIALWLPINNKLELLITSADNNPFSFFNMYVGSVVVIISTPIVMAFKLQEDHGQLAELQQEKLHTELKWLQQQINPHFLFNTLNNLYSLCLSKSAQAPDAILQLANLLRFVVYKGSEDVVELKAEIEYLKDYLSLQQLRVANKCQFDIDINEQNIAGLLVSPLLMVNFLENAIKHGIEPSNENSFLKVSLKVENMTLQFVCENSVSEHVARESNDSGIGLKNVSRRLALMYPEKHQLRYQGDSSSYRVELSLELEKKFNESAGYK
jgi:sensor histidine kinase YesM